ncbi:MAG: response regulator transcription factor [Cyanobacteriota bacterium]|nr:response regulator transcription factor [Cyanobacteriota bacterium]
MDFTAQLPAVLHNRSLSYEPLRGRRVVLGFGGRALLLALLSNPLRPYTVVGAATTAVELASLVDTQRPDLLFCGDRLEAGDPLALLESVLAAGEPARVLLLLSSTPGMAARAQRAIEAGCDGLLVENQLGTGSLVAAMHALCGGGVYVDRSLADTYRRHRTVDAGPLLSSLSPRELEVLSRVAAGMPNAEIGRELHVSAETVKSHLGHLIRKLGVRDRTHAAVIGLKHGLIDYP